ncbi:hypothetical protein [Pseudomonas lini]|uniref:hypothetical protein n=1 Tax=Pseudomonas lini TaxID=163011 RepID=UPI00068352ED|nr:hypothetical protein [Pseudomonas lini]KNH42583.1 hypothetical protein ACS73_29270 [Pseudomonas lini]
MDVKKPRQSTGTMSATISYYDEEFVGGSDFAIVEYPDRFFSLCTYGLAQWRVEIPFNVDTGEYCE